MHPGVRLPEVPATPAANYLVTNQHGRSRASRPSSTNANAAPCPQTVLSVVLSFKVRSCSCGLCLMLMVHRLSLVHCAAEHRAASRTSSSPNALSRPHQCVGFQADPWEPPSNDTVVYNAADAPPHDKSDRAWYIQSHLHDWRGAFGTPAIKGTFVEWALQVYQFDPEESEDAPIPPIGAMILCIQVIRSDHHSHSVLRSSWSVYVELESDEDNNFILAADVRGPNRYISYF
ncbi:hypothetical protein B0H17DRAFT_1134570 [Mycena rosella]|uniref:Uncharacterized protein n=1 Tax=Mycena rosella TaxID=1033263 RepID=A0AAD7DFG3_MYCRO|nr:hypothetical protein B0H17DRAFT_1134570 [Mycena rosella]